MDECNLDRKTKTQYVNIIIQVGALLFAVCRGKLAEGVDLSDSRSRGVIVVGIPYSYRNDPVVAAKMQYMVSSCTSSSSAKLYSLFLTGNLQFDQQINMLMFRRTGRS